MSWHPVTRPTVRRTSVLEVSFMTVVATAVLVLVYAQMLAVTVVVDGRQVRVPIGATVGDVARSAFIKAERGDLYAVDGSILATSAGGAITLERNGRSARMSDRLYSRDRLESVDGSDAVEGSVTETQPAAPDEKVIGGGAFVHVVRRGTPGVIRVVKGAMSGKEISRRAVSQGTPMLVLRTRSRGPARLVALTFDDGPWPKSTDAVLRVLKRERVKATFFVTGTRARRSPGVVRRIVREGHQLGNHTATHRYLDGAAVGRTAVRWEIQHNQAVIRAASGGVTPRWFRPPGGIVNGVIVDETRRADMRMALWDVDPSDWKRPGAGRIVERVVSAVEPGSVVLLHDGGGDRTQTVEALTWIVRQLKQRGYTFVTLDELAKLGG